MRRIAIACCVFVLLTAAARRRSVAPPATWNASLTLAKTDSRTVGSRTFASSTKLVAQWIASSHVDHYELTATETAGGAPLVFVASGTKTSTTLAALESGTEYRVEIRACADAACASPSTGGSATATTDEEFWQVRGTGSSFATADKVVTDGNTKAFALLWGSDAGATLGGRAQLYYDPMSGSEKGVKIGTMSSTIASADSVSSFSPLPGYGFRRADSAGNMGHGPATFQVVALSSRLGAKVRLFYEASDPDGAARVYTIDSRDGWLGRDFHSGAATICQESDLVAGGACAPTLAVGVASDGNPNVKEARQLKVGLPTLTRWTWDEEPGTFMVVTIHFGSTTCSSEFFNMGYAIWDGTRWNLQYGANGCPKLIPTAQAPFPVHLGGARFKLYFNHNMNRSGSPNQFKPMELLYADGAATGNASLVEFEDWEPLARSRRVNFFWPSGALLTDDEKSMFDDYQIWMPTGDAAVQVMYSNMNCPSNACGPPFIGMAVLLNP